MAIYVKPVSLGATVGGIKSVGLRLGIPDSESKSLKSEGIVLGAPDGTEEYEGNALGATDGIVDSEGIAVGALDGLILGVLDGIIDGKVESEGVTIGAFDGKESSGDIVWVKLGSFGDKIDVKGITLGAFDGTIVSESRTPEDPDGTAGIECMAVGRIDGTVALELGRVAPDVDDVECSGDIVYKEPDGAVDVNDEVLGKLGDKSGI